jgi:hypothetical protein
MKYKEEFGVQVTEEQLRAIADSKHVGGVHKAPPHKHVMIITAPKGWVAPKQTVASAASASTASHEATAASAVCHACGQPVKK